MAIEQLGESLLAQAKSRRKKEEKKGKLFGAALLGVQVGNMFLRKQAEKRANEFWTSNRGLIDKKTKQFQAGMNFWTDHNTMMKGYGMGVTDTDWKNAFKQKQYDIYKQRELGKTKLSELNAEKLKEFENMVNPLIEDDIKAYEQKLELFRNFENIKDTEENKKLFLAPVTNKFAEAKKIIDKEANVGSYLLNKLGLRETGLETVTVEGQDVLLPRRMSSEQKQVIVDNIKLNNMYLKNIDDIDKTVKYTPFTDEQIAQFVSTSSWKSKPDSDFVAVINKAISEDNTTRLETPLGTFEYNTAIGNKKTIRDIYKHVFQQQQIEGATAFLDDVYAFSMEARKQYEANPENRGKPKSAEYFINIGFKEYIKKSNLISEEEKKEINLREKEEINRQFMNSEIQIGEIKVTPLQIQKAFLSGQYTQEQKENLYMQLVKQFENISQAQGFLNNLESSISKEDEEERKISPFFQYETKFRKNPLST